MDLLNKLLKWIDHNRNVVLGLVITGLMVFYVTGCESTTSSMKDPTVKVTRHELSRELESAKLAIEAKYSALEAEAKELQSIGEMSQADLDQQDAKKKAIFDTVGSAITQLATGVVNPASLITGALTLGGMFVGGGALLDNRRKDKVIVANKEKK